MKNFFKKLSFVLALAMVLTSVAPATASAAAKNFIKVNGTSTTVTTSKPLTVWIGGVVRNLDYSINGKTSGVSGKWTSSKKSVATVNAKTGVVTPVANGTTTITFTAENGTKVSGKVYVRTRATSINVWNADYTTAYTKDEKPALEVKAGTETKVGLSMNPKKGGKKATYRVYAESSNEDVATVTVSNAMEVREATVVAKAAGEATLTFVAAQSMSMANAKAAKYHVENTVKVVVTEDVNLSAKQTGVKKITVTGKDLTDKVADYKLLRNEVAVTVDKVELNEAKTEAVLVAASAKFPAGTYTVKVGENATPEFTVEDGKIAKFVVAEDLVLDGQYGVASSGTVSYQVLNQFEEDITKTYTDISASCTLGVVTGNTTDYTNKKILITNISTYHTLGTTGKVILIATDGSGVQCEATVAINNPSVPASVEVKGVWSTLANKYVDLKANVDYSYMGLNLVVGVKDQYNDTFAAGLTDTDVSIIVNPALTGFDVAKNLSGVYTATAYNADLDGYCIPIVATNKFAAGDVNFIFVLKNAVAASKNVNATVTIAPTAKVASIEVYPLDTVYQGEVNEFGYTAYDEDGNAVTSYALLTDSDYGVNCPNGFYFDQPAYDDVAKLYFDATNPLVAPAIDKDGLTRPYSGMFSTAKYGFTKMVSFNYARAAHPQFVLGVDSDVYLGKIGTGSSITLTSSDIKFADQYGRVMDNTENYSGYTIVVSAAVDTPQGTTVSGTSINLNGSAYQDLDIVTAGAASFKLVLKKGSDVVKGSETTITVRSAALTDMVRFEADEIGTLSVTGTSINTITTRENETVAVYGYSSDGIKFEIASTYYNVVSDLVNANTNVVRGSKASDAVGFGSGQVDSKDYTVKVAIKNNAGTELSQTVTVKRDAATVATVAQKQGHKYISIATSSATTANFAQDVVNKLEVKDIYGYVTGDSYVADNATVDTKHIKNIYIYDCLDATDKLDNNNTASAGFASADDCSDCMVKITFDSGVEYTTRVHFN